MLWLGWLADRGLEQIVRQLACDIFGQIFRESDELYSALFECAFQLYPGLRLVCAGGCGEEVKEQCGQDEKWE